MSQETNERQIISQSVLDRLVRKATAIRQSRLRSGLVPRLDIELAFVETEIDRLRASLYGSESPFRDALRALLEA
jgi:hypothetical protein